MDTAQEIGAEYGLSSAEVRFLLSAATRTPQAKATWSSLATLSMRNASFQAVVNFNYGAPDGGKVSMSLMDAVTR